MTKLQITGNCKVFFEGLLITHAKT